MLFLCFEICGRLIEVEDRKHDALRESVFAEKLLYLLTWRCTVDS